MSACAASRAVMVGRTPWSAADALVGQLHERGEKRVQGDPRGLAPRAPRPPHHCGAGWNPAAGWQPACCRLQMAAQRRLATGAQDAILPHKCWHSAHQHLFTTSASAAVKVAEPFKLSGRVNAMPRAAAYPRKSTSMSYRISTWSQTKPMGAITTSRTPWAA